MPTTDYLKREERAMIDVFTTMGVPPKATRGLLNNNLFDSFGNINERLKEESLASIAPDDIGERSFNIIAQVVTYMNVKGLTTFLSVTDQVLSDMQHSLRENPPMDESLVHFCNELTMTAKDAYILNVRYHTHSYVTLCTHTARMGDATLNGIDKDAQILIWKCLKSMTHPEVLETLEDPLGDFNYAAFLREESTAFLKKVGFTESDINNVCFELTYCSYQNLMKYRHDIMVGVGCLGQVPADRRADLGEVIQLMERSMVKVHKELRISMFDFTAFWLDVNVID